MIEMAVKELTLPLPSIPMADDKEKIPCLIDAGKISPP